MMEVVRKIVDAQSLMTVIALPEALQNRKLEVIILPADEPVPAREKVDIQSAVQSLIGAVPYTDLSLPELREERLGKYETAD